VLEKHDLSGTLKINDTDVSTRRSGNLICWLERGVSGWNDEKVELVIDYASTHAKDLFLKATSNRLPISHSFRAEKLLASVLEVTTFNVGLISNSGTLKW
jgi:hypothetical protein